jgi:hypothetical protein
MTIALRSAFRRAANIRNTALLACIAVVSLHAQTNATGATSAKTPATNAKTANPAATPAKPATAVAAKPMVNAGAAPQANAQVANSIGLVPVAAQTPIPSAPAAAKPNVATASPAPTATAPAATSGASPTAAAPASWSPAAASQVGSPTAAGSSSNGSRSAVGGLGVGTFLWPGGWTLTAYGCFRTGTRLFCDFDTINQNNLQAASNIWSGGGGVNLVDDGGKITVRHNAFFVGQDGSQFPTAYISPQPVRFIIEYDDVDPRYTSVSLVLGRERIQGVPITLIDPSQPQGKMPARPVVSNVAPSGANAGTTGVNAATPGAAGTQQAGQPGTGALDKADSTVNNANNQKKKAQSLWRSLQGVAQSH